MNKRSVLAGALSSTGMLPLISRLVPWSGLLVLNYHRIGAIENSRHDHGLWSADADAFAEQVRIFKSHVHVIDPQQLPDVLKQGRGRYGMITFDDGYRDNYELALPVLESEGVRAAFFVATGFVDQPSLPWWDEIAWMVRSSQRSVIEMPDWLPAPLNMDEPLRELAVRSLLRKYKILLHVDTGDFMRAIAAATGSGRCPPGSGQGLWMTWDMLRALRDAGMTIGGHTVHHPLLASLEPAQQRREISECCQRLQTELGEPPEWFSYPVGRPSSFNAATRQYLREAGIRYAASYYGGYRSFSDWDDLDIRRVAIETELSLEWFRAIVSLPGWFTRLAANPGYALGTGS